jgi:protein gp37
MRRLGKRSAGRLLDGRTWDEMPAWLEENQCK